MCVAAVIFKSVSLDYLTCMENDNPHGAGLAWEQDGRIYFVKGLTAKEIFDMQEMGVVRYPYLMHYRWATHGDKVPELTHPFPIGPRALLGELAGYTDKLLIHNGTWNWHMEQAAKHVAKGNYELPEEIVSCVSDTAVAAWLAYYNEDILDSVPWATAVAEMRETMDEQGNPVRTMDITTRGTWYDKDGNWYSNLNWVPYYRTMPGMSHWGNYGSCEGGEYNFYETPISAAEQRQANELRAWVRRNDKKYVGKYSDIEVSSQYYQMWFPEKDNQKPENTEWQDWYDRFDWAAMMSDGPESAEKNIEKKRGMTWDEYKAKYGDTHNEGFVKKDADAGTSWNDYIVAKYGPAVAAEINSCFSEDDAGEASEGDAEADAALKGWYRDPSDPDWLHEDDLITENPETVNAWLAKQMVA